MAPVNYLLDRNDDSIIFLSDSYKVTHWPQYPPGTQSVLSFLESRGGEFPAIQFSGLQGILLRHFTTPVTLQDVEQAEAFFYRHLPGLFNKAGWEHIVRDHGGKLPLKILAVPEGTVVPVGNVLMTVENTCPDCYWVTNYVESLLLQVWYPTTVGTISYRIKNLLRYCLRMTTGGEAGLEYMLNDFGFRGTSSVESARIGGAAHLRNFSGSDNIQAILYANRYYNRPIPQGVPAAEHSTITSWGRENEDKAYGNMLHQYPTGLVAVVSDSYNIYRACEEIWGGCLRDSVLSRDGVVVIRPDSGHPPEVVVKVLTILGDRFGYTVNDRGYRVLDPHVRVIQGDGINEQSIGEICLAMIKAGWSVENIVFGMGGALLQMMNRDTCKFAFKCCAIKRDGAWQNVSKDPVTDPGKRSKAGRLKLVKGPNGFETVQHDDPRPNELVPYYINGAIFTA